MKGVCVCMCVCVCARVHYTVEFLVVLQGSPVLKGLGKVM